MGDIPPSEKNDTMHGEIAEKPLQKISNNALQDMDGTDYHEILPKPSADPNDPLNWSWAQKHCVMGLVAFMAFQGPFDSASPAAGFVEQSKAFGVPTAKMLDSIGPHAIFLGIGGLLWVPLAHRYGRSPIYVCAAAVATLGALGCALSNSLGAFIGARVVNGIGCSASMSLGSLTVKDLFFVHERGQKIGIWTLFIGISPYVATILDGFVTTYAGWRWMQWLTFIVWAVLTVFSLVLLPETLYDRDVNLAIIPPRQTYIQQLRWKKFGGNLTFRSFTRPFLLLKYPAILFPIFYYGNMYGFCVFGALGVLPFAFVEIYGFSATGQGLVAVALLVGTILGEPMAGPFSDWIVRYQAKRHGGIRHPEQRLQAIWLGAVLIPIGLIIFGTTLFYKVHWIAPCIGIGIYSFALQIVSTVVFTYPVDCYEHMAGEVGLVCNMGRQILSFYVTFYLTDYTTKVGYAWAYGIYAILSVVLFIPVLGLMIWGGKIRQRLGMPKPYAMEKES